MTESQRKAPDREKVIRGLECCKSSACPGDCPYLSVNKCIPRLCDDAIALLREQEREEDDGK